MRVFLTGATGWIGSMLVRQLLEAGHSVVGLASNKEKGEALAAAGAAPAFGAIEDLASLRRAAEGADGIVHTAFGLDRSRIAELAAQDAAAIVAFGDVLAGSDRPCSRTSRASQQTAFALADRGPSGSAASPKASRPPRLAAGAR